MTLSIVILAAGMGTRMYSTVPKVLHRLAGKPLLQHVIETAKLFSDDVMVVYGYGGEVVKEALASFTVRWIFQKEQLGTAHAVLEALPFLNQEGRTLVLLGDAPLISSETLKNLLDRVPQTSFGWLTAELDNPTGLGRIIRDEDRNPIAIVEEKDASDKEKEIKEISTGVCLIPNQYLHEFLPKVKNNNNQKEYYLPTIFSMAVEKGIHIVTVSTHDQMEAQGINNKYELAQLERAYQFKQAEKFMRAGLTLLDPHRFDLRGKLNVGQDSLFDVNVILEGEVEIGSRCYIGPNCLLKNVKLGDDVRIEANSILEEAIIEEACVVGPFARLRPGAVLKEHAKVGNFVEVKKSTIGKNSKVNHLSYIGDATLGEHVNIGAGTITCNYDGVNKYQTIIGDEAFIGSNTSLIAPIEVGARATVGAGSAVSKAVPAEQLTLTRAKQTTIPSWKRPVKKSTDRTS